MSGIVPKREESNYVHLLSTQTATRDKKIIRRLTPVAGSAGLEMAGVENSLVAPQRHYMEEIFSVYQISFSSTF
jgi:hypothetical protein